MLNFFSNSYLQKVFDVPAEIYFHFSNLLAEYLYILGQFVVLFFFFFSSGEFLIISFHMKKYVELCGICIKYMNQSLKQDMDEGCPSDRFLSSSLSM